MLVLQMSRNRKVLFISAHPAYAKRIREAVADIEFMHERKCWVTVASNRAAIEKAFAGEIYYKTPKWFMDGLDSEPEKRLHFFREKAVIEKFKEQPFDYQIEGAQFMVDRIKQFGFCLNSDGVGSGKSFQALMTIDHFMRQKEVSNVLIICKKTIKKQWEEEIGKFTYWKTKIFVTEDGTKKKRNEVYAKAQEAKNAILITNYHNFLNDYAEINSKPWDLVVLDEAHQVKTYGTKMNSLIGHTMRGKRCIFLTATPVLSSPEDIYGIVNMASLTYFGSYKEFEKKYLVIEFGRYGRQIIGAKRLDELAEKVSAFMIRRSEAQISVELPDIMEMPRRSMMDKVQSELNGYIQEQLGKIDDAIDNVMRASEDVDSEMKAKIEEINEQRKMYIAARQFIADDPSIIYELEDGYISRPLKKRMPKEYSGSEKTEGTLDIVESIVSSGEKVIIFCCYSTPARMLKKRIEERLDINVCIYTGDEGMEEREQTKRIFTTNPDYPVLIGTDSMAEGLNLQVARYQIHYEQAKTDAMRTQRIGRSRRIGAKYNKICVYDMITNGSFDEDRINKIAKDKEVTGALLG